MGFITRAVGRRMRRLLEELQDKLEVQAAVARQRHMMAVSTLARDVARTTAGDEVACRELHRRLAERDCDPGLYAGGVPDDGVPDGSAPDAGTLDDGTDRDHDAAHDDEAARRAVEHLSALRTDYLEDRAYRLLTAALTGTPVRGIDPAMRELFGAEAALGAMSLHDAFEHLAALEPRLRELPEGWPPGAKSPGGKPPGSKPPGVKRGPTRSPSEPRLVGPGADSPHAILTTELARQVVGEHRRVPRDQDPTPFFERKLSFSSGTFFLFGRDPRPRAQN